MCGLLFCKRKGKKNSAKRAVIKRYEKQKRRGSAGFGYVSIHDGRIVNYVKKKYEDEIKKSIKEDNSSDIMFHHRLPTSTPNMESSSHPILVKNELLKYTYYFIHNGVIKNEDELRKEHKSLGFDYTTEMYEEKIIRSGKEVSVIESKLKFNDSESLAIEFALYNEGLVSEIKAEGSIAFICLQVDSKGNVVNLHYAHNDGNPLFCEVNGDMFFLRSEGGGSPVPVNKLYTVNYKTNNVTEKDIKLKEYYYTYSKHKNHSFSKNIYSKKKLELPKRTSCSTAKSAGQQNAITLNVPKSASLDLNMVENTFNSDKFEQDLEYEMKKNPQYVALINNIEKKNKRIDEIDEEIIEIELDCENYYYTSNESEIYTQSLTDERNKLEDDITQMDLEVIAIQEDAIISLRNQPDLNA